MKLFFALFVTFILANISFAQDAKDVTQKSGEPVSTVGYIEKHESKSGYGINGFYIQLTQDEYKKYYDRKLEVSGKLLIIKAAGEGEADTYFIEKPAVKILE